MRIVQQFTTKESWKANHVKHTRIEHCTLVSIIYYALCVHFEIYRFYKKKENQLLFKLIKY